MNNEKEERIFNTKEVFSSRRLSFRVDMCVYISHVGVGQACLDCSLPYPWGGGLSLNPVLTDWVDLLWSELQKSFYPCLPVLRLLMCISMPGFLYK